MTEIYIDIDSTYRDRKLYPNPFDMQIERDNHNGGYIHNSRNIICDTFPSKGIPKKIINSHTGAVSIISLQTRGENYNKFGENIKIIGGNNDCIISIPELKIVHPGSGYIPGIYNVSGSGYGLTIQIDNVSTSIEFENENVLSFIDYTNIDYLVDIGNNMYNILDKINNYIIIKNISINQDIDIATFHKFTEDGVRNLSPPGKNKTQKYEMSLINMIVPNLPLNNDIQQLSMYPYVILQFYSGTNKAKENYYFHNPNMEFATFKCVVSYADKYYVRLNSLHNVIKHFNMRDNITFKVLSPEGKVLKYKREDHEIPRKPDNKIQISATIQLRELN